MLFFWLYYKELHILLFYSILPHIHGFALFFSFLYSSSFSFSYCFLLCPRASCLSQCIFMAVTHRVHLCLINLSTRHSSLSVLFLLVLSCFSPVSFPRQFYCLLLPGLTLCPSSLPFHVALSSLSLFLNSSLSSTSALLYPLSQLFFLLFCLFNSTLLFLLSLLPQLFFILFPSSSFSAFVSLTPHYFLFFLFFLSSFLSSSSALLSPPQQLFN